jgi:hypothetical protein
MSRILPWAHLAAGAARKLLGRVRGAAHDHTDLVERHREHVVQHERKPLRGTERVEDNEQRGADRVGQHRLVLGVAPGPFAFDGVGQVRTRGVLAP